MKTHVHKPEPVARTIASSTGQRQPDRSTVLQAFKNNTTQLNTMEEENNESLQGKFITQRAAIDEDKLMQRKSENHTGLPDDLKNGVENLSGFSMNDVRVHYNSHKPAQLQAYAYAQGTDIHIAPGQEKHLPHEAWHVVQQMQGRVQPTMQLQGMKVNTNERLEREADVMGRKSIQGYPMEQKTIRSPKASEQFIQKVSTVDITTQNLPYVDPTGAPQAQGAGANIEAYLDPLDPLCGSAPGGGGKFVLYPLLNLAHATSFIKGHLLNANLGGPGMIENLFPITSDANTAHSHLVEEPIKANFLTLSKHLGLLGGLAGVALPATAARLHYAVDAVWNQAGTGDFLNNPESQFDCRAEFVDAANNSLAQLINTTIVSDPGTPPANTQNTDLNSIGWGSFGAGKRTAPNNFTTNIVGVAPGGGNQWIIQGPQWDNTNTPVRQKVYITCI